MTVFIIYSDGDVTIYLSSNKQGMTSSSIFFFGVGMVYMSFSRVRAKMHFYVPFHC